MKTCDVEVYGKNEDNFLMFQANTQKAKEFLDQFIYNFKGTVQVSKRSASDLMCFLNRKGISTELR